MSSILLYYDFYHANEGTDETKGSTLNTTLTDHAIEQVRERTELHPDDLTRILDYGITTPLGVEIGSRRMHILFYSEADEMCFVAVRDTKTYQVVTVLPVDYDRHTRIDPATVAALTNKHRPVKPLSTPVAKQKINKAAKFVYLRVKFNSFKSGHNFVTLKLPISEFGEDKEALEKNPQVERLLEELIKSRGKPESEYVDAILFQKGSHGKIAKFNLDPKY